METFLEIPSHLIKRKQGFSVDLGGSLIKIVHTEDVGEKVRIHFKSFPTEDFEEALDYMKSCKIKSETTVAMCGINCEKYTETLQSALDISIEVLLEHDCTVDGFQFLTKNFHLDDVTHQMSPYVHEYARQVATSMYKCQELQEKELGTRQKPWLSINKPDKMITPPTVVYPLLLAVNGSAGIIHKVHEDGTYTCLDVNVACGKHLLGLGSLLTGVKTYPELLALAHEGDAGNVDVQGIHLKNPSQDDVYANYPDDNTVFGFGHTIGKEIGDFSRADLAAGVVSSVVQGLASNYHLWALLLQVRQIYFCGGTTNDSLIRDELGKHFECRCMGNAMGIHTDYFFMKYGGYLSALGSLLKNLNR